MPATSKFSTSRLPTSNSRRRSPVLLFICIVCGIGGLLLLAISTLSHTRRCYHSKPMSVSVDWEKSDNVNTWISDDVDGERKNQRFRGFVGIQTGFGSAGRRQSIRKTWLSLDRWGLQRLEESTGLAFRFIIGRSKDIWKMEELKKEVENYDDFMLLDIDDTYSKLPYKTLAFFKAAYALFECDFYVKIDDDVYLRPDRLSLLLAKERSHSQTYMGCMKKGPVFTDPKLKWYEPLSSLLGSEYFLHAYGPIYALSNDVVASLVALKNNSFRMFSNEDVTIGVWMLAMNVNHENNFDLCSPHCTPSAVAVWDIPKCSGLCHPERRMLELHQNMTCRSNRLTRISLTHRIR